MAVGAFALLVLVALAAIVLGCGAGGGSSSQSAEKKATKKVSSTEQKAEGTGSSVERVGRPALGSADAPVVMTEFSDYQ